LTKAFLEQAEGDKRYEQVLGAEITTACKSCLYPIPEAADINLCIVGAQPAQQIWLEAQSDKGDDVLNTLGIPTSEEAPAKREQAVDQLIKGNKAFWKTQSNSRIKLISTAPR